MTATKGTLFLVPTPIGNLGDITFRAVEVLKQVQVVLAEDTRTSGRLLQHYQIDTTLESFHQHNEHGKLASVMQRLHDGVSFALISDAGTPGISDPGFLLARACKEQGIRMECLPGATAFVPALVQSGFPLSSFLFGGFLPQKKGRQKTLLHLLSAGHTLVLYESPYRLLRLLEELHEHAPDRPVSVSRELTKKFEEQIQGSAQELTAHFRKQEPRGEFVVVVGPSGIAVSDEITE
jgi:16S rRNA (cytidine1402-2'-O)-methyltransferase